MKIYKRICNNCNIPYKGRGKFFCSYECKGEKMIYSGNPNWKGGLIKKDRGNPQYGFYLYIKLHGHHRSDRLGYVKRSDLVAEKYLKRKLKKYEIVHHIDNNKSNDNPKNLYVLTKKKHDKLKNNKILKSNIFKGRRD